MHPSVPLYFFFLPIFTYTPFSLFFSLYSPVPFYFLFFLYHHTNPNSYSKLSSNSRHHTDSSSSLPHDIIHTLTHASTSSSNSWNYSDLNSYIHAPLFLFSSPSLIPNSCSQLILSLAPTHSITQALVQAPTQTPAYPSTHNIIHIPAHAITQIPAHTITRIPLYGITHLSTHGIIQI